MLHSKTNSAKPILVLDLRRRDRGRVSRGASHSEDASGLSPKRPIVNGCTRRLVGESQVEWTILEPVVFLKVISAIATIIVVIFYA